MRKKHFIAKLLSDTMALDLLASTSGGDLIVFNYHRLRPNDPGFVTPFDDGVYGPTALQFYEQMRWFKQHRRVLSEQELIDNLRMGKSLRHCVLITFDDAYRDNFTLAYPILKELALPAIFFVPTHLIQTRQLGWWDIIAYLIKHSQKPIITFEGKQLSRQQREHQLIQFFAQKMKLEPSTKTGDLLAKLAEACDVNLPPLSLQDSQLMTWDQIRQVAQDNITIGSHTHTHRVLATLDWGAQQEELTLSKTILERELGQPVRSIAYPVGGLRHFTEQTEQIAKDNGYALTFSYRTGLNGAENLAARQIKRASGPQQFSMAPAMSVLPKLFIEAEDASRYQYDEYH